MVASSRFTLQDGATLAYDIFGLEQLGKGRLPMVMVGGMGSVKIDWERLIPSLSSKRPVLVYDHRGMGESTLSIPENDDKVTIESLARDLLALVKHVGWQDVDLLGFSMGGVVLQQLLVLPSHATDATPLPFRVHHALLTDTFCSALRRTALALSSPVTLQAPVQPLTVEQRKEIARPMVDASLGPKWIALPGNTARYELWLDRAIQGRPFRTIMKQREALSTLKLGEELIKIPSSTKVLVIHGQEDMLVPYSNAEEILRFLPHARMVQIGSKIGQVPNYDFGHLWYEYFEIDVWIGVIETFVDDAVDPSTTRL